MWVVGSCSNSRSSSSKSTLGFLPTFIIPQKAGQKSDGISGLEGNVLHVFGCPRVMVAQSCHLLHPGRACGAKEPSSPPTHELEAT